MTNEFELVDALDVPLQSFSTVTAPANGLAVAGCVLAKLHGFDLEDRPLISGIEGLPGELVVARSTVALSREMLGAQVVLAFENRDLRLPIVVGALQTTAVRRPPAPATSVRIDDGERLVLKADRELVLQCGDASITLTRAGKVLIRGAYVLSQSSGYNRLKGAAIDIN